jgi:hypothetical protein
LRTGFGNEEDFVVQGENDFCAIEVQNTPKLRSKSINSRSAIEEDCSLNGISSRFPAIYP